MEGTRISTDVTDGHGFETIIICLIRGHPSNPFNPCPLVHPSNPCPLVYPSDPCPLIYPFRSVVIRPIRFIRVLFLRRHG